MITPDTPLRVYIETELARLKHEREQFLVTVNLRLGDYNGRIAALEELAANGLVPDQQEVKANE